MKSQQAYPSQFTPHHNSEYHYGLNKLEYFSGLAMQGLLSSGNKWINPGDYIHMAKLSVNQAKELIKQLKVEDN